MLLQFVKDSYLILCFMQMSMHILQVAFDTVLLFLLMINMPINN